MAGEITAVAVLPFENLTGDQEQEYFVDGMTDELITELGKISALRVISRTSAMSLKGRYNSAPSCRNWAIRSSKARATSNSRRQFPTAAKRCELSLWRRKNSNARTIFAWRSKLSVHARA
jgi:hypothetical protein